MTNAEQLRLLNRMNDDEVNATDLSNTTLGECLIFLMNDIYQKNPNRGQLHPVVSFNCYNEVLIELTVRACSGDTEAEEIIDRGVVVAKERMNDEE